MAIKRGTANISRNRARNYTHEAAQKRLDEVVQPFNDQVENSLKVDSIEIEYYSIQNKVGIPCTCEKTAVDHRLLDQHDTNIAPVIPTKDSDHSGIHVKFQDDEIFGDSIAEKIYNDDSDKIMDMSGDDTTFAHEIEDAAEGDERFEDGLMGGGSVNCGVCYRTGMQPPYKAYGKQRFLFTNHHIEEIDGYFVNTTKAPHTMERHEASAPGYVMFRTIVPKYFQSVLVTVRDNLVNLVAERILRLDGEPVTAGDLRSHAGREFPFLVKADCFTHVVLEFSLAVPSIHANISGENAALDYERLTTISDINVILPPSLAEVEPGDVLVLKSRNLVLKVRDKERKMTADRRRLEWVVSTRVLQPTEALRNIHNGYKLY